MIKNNAIIVAMKPVPFSHLFHKDGKPQKVIFLRVAPELHTALKAQAKNEGATINKFLTKQIEQISAAATLRSGGVAKRGTTKATTFQRHSVKTTQTNGK